MFVDGEAWGRLDEEAEDGCCVLLGMFCQHMQAVLTPGAILCRVCVCACEEGGGRYECVCEEGEGRCECVYKEGGGRCECVCVCEEGVRCECV